MRKFLLRPEGLALGFQVTSVWSLVGAGYAVFYAEVNS